MSLWLLLGAMTALAAALVAWPLLRPPAAPSGRRDYELQVYRAQLEELAREQERGLLGEREAQAAKLEVERRMLAADAAASPQAGGRAPQTGRWAIAALIALPLLAVGLYWPFGRPDLPSAPFAGRADERRLAREAAEAPGPSVESMIARLEQRVAERPDDLEAWQRLGQAFDLAGRYDDAVRARREALALDGSAAANAALGEALVMANGGAVTPAAREAFERALALDAADPRARFYRGLGLLQAGDRQGALDAWIALIESSPADAPWLPELQRRVDGARRRPRPRCRRAAETGGARARAASRRRPPRSRAWSQASPRGSRSNRTTSRAGACSAARTRSWASRRRRPMPIATSPKRCRTTSPPSSTTPTRCSRPLSGRDGAGGRCRSRCAGAHARPDRSRRPVLSRPGRGGQAGDAAAARAHWQRLSPRCRRTRPSGPRSSS